MQLKKIIIASLVSFILLCSCIAQKKSNYKLSKSLLRSIDHNFYDAAAQYKLLMKNLSADKFPQNIFPGKKQL